MMNQSTHVYGVRKVSPLPEHSTCYQTTARRLCRVSHPRAAKRVRIKVYIIRHKCIALNIILYTSCISACCIYGRALHVLYDVYRGDPIHYTAAARQTKFICSDVYAYDVDGDEYV
uniref:Uncharacterized protein n=1 Tax=Schizaphis graminum TaxID=13262 RepID=A0A2S2PJY2_SCHGA